MPVDMIIGLPIAATLRISGRSVLERGDLVGRDIEAFEEVDGGFVERRRKEDHAMASARVHDRLVPFPGRIGLLVEIVQVRAGPRRSAVGDLEIAAAESIVIVSAV